jgi:hypothetical protein
MLAHPNLAALSKDERGQGQVLTLILAVLILSLLLGLGAFVAHVQPVKVAVHAAARNCARMAAESLAEGRGVEQGHVAAYQTMADMSFDPAFVDVLIVQGEYGWDRGESISCHVRYAVDVGWMPFVDLFYSGQAVYLQSSSALRIEPYKSRWDE